MKTSLILCGVLCALSIPAFAQTTPATSGAQSQAGAAAQSGSGASANTGNITINQNSQTRRHTSVDTTPSLYAPPSMFGGQNNCGMSDTLAIGVTGFGIGGSRATESLDCNSREDTGIAYKLGFKDVADLRFFCFGSSLNRKAYEAAGHKCPADSTAEGLTGAPTTQSNFKTNQNVASGSEVNPVVLDTNDRAQRERTNYWGTDPVVMQRLGITK